MKVLFIGGTGTISRAITRKVIAEGHELYLLNRGTWNSEFDGKVKVIQADINNEEEKVAEAIKDLSFDVVADFIVFTREQAERDFRLFNGKTKQYMTLSSATVYQKPPVNYISTEGAPQCNPGWPYAQNKIKVEAFLMDMYRECGFPVTIVRPSHTYDERSLPLAVDGSKGFYQIVDRVLHDKPVLVQGDGTTQWTCTFSTDFAKGFYGLMGNPRAIGENFHITTDVCMTWNQLYEYLGEALGKKVKIVHVPTDFLIATGAYGFEGLVGDKSLNGIYDNSKIKSVVPEFQCTVRPDQGFKISCDYILSHPEEYVKKLDPEFDAFCDAVVETLEKAANDLKAKFGK